MSVIGIDLGGTKIAVGAFQNGELKSHLTFPTPQEGGDAIVQLMGEAALQAAREARLNPLAVGLATPGPLDYRSGSIRFAPNLKGVDNFPIQQKLAEKLGLPTRLENDANAAALAEHHLGAAQGATSSLFITISTGIGGGVILDGKPLRGSHGQGAEIGHLTVLPGGPMCGCGNAGCLEALASGRALAREATFAYQSRMTTHDLFERFQGGEEKAVRILWQAAHHVGVALASCVKAFDPEVIVLGGGIAVALGDTYLNMVRDSYQQSISGWVAPPIEAAHFGNEAGVLGAALAAELIDIVGTVAEGQGPSGHCDAGDPTSTFHNQEKAESILASVHSNK